jgi:glycosyltransferase involved in cell wall biosynthesis
MRQLRDRYDFVVVTTDPVEEARGTLNHQLPGLVVALYELGELAPQSHFLLMLEKLEPLYRPALVWICNGSPWQCHFSGAIRSIFHRSAIVDQTVYDTRVGWIEWYHEQGIRSYDHYIAVNEEIRRTLVEERKLDSSSVSLIYSAVDTAAFRPESVSAPERARQRERYDLREDEMVLVWIGRLHPQKRPELFLACAAEITRRRRDVRFLVVGDGVLRGRIQRFVERNPDARVTWTPYVEDTRHIWSIASGYVVTSAYEALPVAMIEALCMGVPVFASDVGDIRLILERYDAGEVFPRAAKEGEVVDRLARWLERREEHGERARDAAVRVREFFDSRRAARQYDECWQALLAERATSASAGGGVDRAEPGVLVMPSVGGR